LPGKDTATGIKLVPEGRGRTDDTIGRRECDCEVEQATPTPHIEPIERLTQRRGGWKFLDIADATNPRHRDESVEKRPIRRILPYLR
jgi:hypothetical protein